MRQDLNVGVFAANDKGMKYPPEFGNSFKKATYKYDEFVVIKLEDRLIDKGMDIG